MSVLPVSIQKLIDELSKLPGIGRKTAARLTFYLLKQPEMELASLGEAVSTLRQDLKLCQACWNFSETDPCAVCNNLQRKAEQIMVVEDPLDVMAFERTNEYHGTYHVLHGLLNPIDGIGPDKLTIDKLLKRLQGFEGKAIELILATNPSLEGEATATYIHRQLQNIPNLKITRLARGLPVGGDLEYADEITLSQALQGRRDY